MPLYTSRWPDSSCCPASDNPHTFIPELNYVYKQALPVAAKLVALAQIQVSVSVLCQPFEMPGIVQKLLRCVPSPSHAASQSNGRINQQLDYCPKHTPADISCSCNCNWKAKHIIRKANLIKSSKHNRMRSTESNAHKATQPLSGWCFFPHPPVHTLTEELLPELSE